MNQLFAIKPYRWEGLWVFDAPERGLVREPLVAGIPEMIEQATQQAGIANADQGFVALFSKDPFPGADIVLHWVRGGETGDYYAWAGLEGWLCPALLKYFPTPPRTIYVQVRAAEGCPPSLAAWIDERLRSLEPLLAQPASPDRIREWARNLAHEAWALGRRGL